MPQVFATANPLPKQVGDDNTVGTFIVPTLDSAGNPSKLTLFGSPTITATGLQQSGGAQAAITRGQAAGAIGTFASTATPAAIATLTSAEVTLTPVQGTGAIFTITTTDMVLINKPTAQAGLGYGNVRYASASTIGLTFHNVTAGTLTPTAAEIYGIVAVRGLGSQSVTLTPASVATKTTAEQQFTVTGLRVGELVAVNKPTLQAGLDIVGARVVSNNVLGITFANYTAGTLTPTAGEAYTVQSLGGMDASTNLVNFQGAVVGTQTVATITTAEVTITSGNFAAQDIVVGTSKPTLQAGLGIAGNRISTTTLRVLYVNPTAGTLTPTAAEVYDTAIFRQNPAAPLVIYTQTITPAAVASLTTAEQTFTVTGLVAGSPVWVNKPSVQQGLGISGARVSSANTLAITYMNITGVTLTPAAETYTIANFQMPIDTTTGNSWVQGATPALTQNSVLTNAIRANDVALAIMPGA